MKSWYPLFAIVVVGAGAAVVFERRGGDAELSRMRADISSLSQALDDIRANKADTPPWPPSAPPPMIPEVRTSPLGPKEEPSSEAPEAARAPEPTEVLSLFETRFRREGAISPWTAEARQVAETRAAAVLPESSELHSVECNSSMCRIETVHEDRRDYDSFVWQAFVDPEKKLWNGGFYSAIKEAGEDRKFVAIAYLARDGEPLPPVWEIQ